jgi:formate C-acetyltransferase
VQNPNDHKDLMVRVSGYCARFVDLPPDIQTEITERTIH